MALLDLRKGIHGWEAMAPLKPPERQQVVVRYPGIHGWEAMAPLKLVEFRVFVGGESRIHGWEAMAPLKRRGVGMHPDGAARIHGWEAMAPLKQFAASDWHLQIPQYPWLGGHGSIEASPPAHVRVGPVAVSMAGRPWLH